MISKAGYERIEGGDYAFVRTFHAEMPTKCSNSRVPYHSNPPFPPPSVTVVCESLKATFSHRDQALKRLSEIYQKNTKGVEQKKKRTKHVRKNAHILVLIEKTMQLSTVLKEGNAQERHHGSQDKGPIQQNAQK